MRRSLSEPLALPVSRGTATPRASPRPPPPSPAPPVNSGPLAGGERERSSHWPHAPSFPSLPQATGGLVADSEEERVFAPGCWISGGGWRAEARDWEGGMRRDDSSLAPLPSDLRCSHPGAGGVRNPSPRRVGREGAGASRQPSAFGFQLRSPRRPATDEGRAPVRRPCSLLGWRLGLAPHPGLGFRTAAGLSAPPATRCGPARALPQPGSRPGRASPLPAPSAPGSTRG